MAHVDLTIKSQFFIFHKGVPKLRKLAVVKLIRPRYVKLSLWKIDITFANFSHQRLYWSIWTEGFKIDPFWIQSCTMNVGYGRMQEFISNQGCNPSRTLCSSMQSLLQNSNCTNTLYFGERAFAFTGPKLWNSIPEHII